MTRAATRKTELRQMLDQHRRVIQDQVQNHIRDGRTGQPTLGDHLEASDVNTQRDIDLALVQMRAQTIVRIDEALVRLDTGRYGSCVECEKDISALRLRALPFAVRCQSCEAHREEEQGQARRVARRHESIALFPTASSA